MPRIGSTKPVQTPQAADALDLRVVKSDVQRLEKMFDDHERACSNDKTGDRRSSRVTTMLSILDNLKAQVMKCHSVDTESPPKPALRRCNTDFVNPNEKEWLKKELNASLSARKNLEILLRCTDKEKNIIATELAVKVHELEEVSELVSLLQAQNAKMVNKMHDWLSEQKGTDHLARTESNRAIVERNQVLSEKLGETQEAYQSIYWKLKETQQENDKMQHDLCSKAVKCVQKLQKVKDLLLRRGEVPDEVRAEIGALETMLHCFRM